MPGGNKRQNARRVSGGALLDAFRGRTSDARYLANFVLHAALSIPGGGTPIGLVTKDGHLILQVPDRLTRPVEIFDEFTFDEGREARTYVAELLRAVEDFVDGLLDAFERARPARFGP